MSILPRAWTSRGLALLLAAAMPLCCCAIRGLMGTSSCCIEAPVAESCCMPATCCSDVAEDAPPAQDDSPRGACSCCIKAPVVTDSWTPPVDEIGSDLFQMPGAIDVVAHLQDLPPRYRAGAPPPEDLRHEAAPLRGSTILQV